MSAKRPRQSVSKKSASKVNEVASRPTGSPAPSGGSQSSRSLRVEPLRFAGSPQVLEEAEHGVEAVGVDEGLVGLRAAPRAGRAAGRRHRRPPARTRGACRGAACASGSQSWWSRSSWKRSAAGTLGSRSGSSRAPNIVEHFARCRGLERGVGRRGRRRGSPAAKSAKGGSVAAVAWASAAWCPAARSGTGSGRRR